MTPRGATDMIRTASMRHRRLRASLALAGVLAATQLWGAGTVTNTADSGAGSLRSAVIGGGAVTFSPALNGQTITLASAIVLPSTTSIVGPGANLLSVSGGGATRLFAVLAPSSVSISGVTLTQAAAGSSAQGGAIANDGALTLSRVAVSSNTAGDSGGGVYNDGALTVLQSVFNNNSVIDAGCAGGGAIRSEGPGSTLVISDSTITGNSAISCSGGGISFNDGTTSITGGTIASNTAGSSGGNLYKGSSVAVLTLASTLVSDGSAGGGTPVNTDLQGAFGGGLVSAGYSLVRSRGDATGFTATDLPDGTAPQYTALANNGGPTSTLALQVTSPLRDARSTACATLADQRVIARPQGPACDIGAFEYRQNLLTAAVVGSGTITASGAVPLNGAIGSCTTSCTAYYDGEVTPPTVQLTATPGSGQRFTGWSGDCTGSLSPFALTMDAPKSCTATFGPNNFTVTPSVGSGSGTISPSAPQTVVNGGTATFTLAPAANFHIASVGGSCGGSLSGNAYTTNEVSADCTVIANFAIDTHIVSPSVSGGNGTIAPATPQAVDHGSTTSFALTPAASYHIANVTGTCGGSLAGNVYTTAAVVADCSVVASFAIDTFTVTPSVTGGNGTIAPATPQTVNSGSTASFTLAPSATYHVASVTGTCGGTLTGNVYTTNPISSNCTVIASFAIDTFTVTPSVAGGNGTIAPATPQTVNSGSTTSFALTPAATYHVASVTGTCGGTLAGNVYTTNAISANCSVVASFAIDTFTVTPSVTGGNGTIAPATPQSVNSGSTTSFTLTPAATYHVAAVTGTCGGTLAGNVYTTAAISANCTVIASFAVDTFTVTPSVAVGNGTITPATPQTVNSGATTTFTLAPAATYHVASVTGTCGGTLAGNVYTTNAISANCTVIANFAIDTFTVTPILTGGHGTISPATQQTVNSGATTSFTLTPAATYHVVSVTGTCGGTLTGNVYTTNPISANCSVVARFAIDTFTVTPILTGGNGTISPSSQQTVNSGATPSFTLTPAANYHVAGVTGTCGGTLSGNVYTTNPISANCTVVARFAVDTFTVTPILTGGNGTISPAAQQTVNSGATTSFTLTPAANYHVAGVSGTCGGTLTGNVYTTNPISANCTVVGRFAIDTHIITSSVSGGNGTIATATPQSVDYGATARFTLAPSPGHHVDQVTGTCGGTRSGNVYTTDVVIADCTVIASFALDTYTVGGTVSGRLGSGLVLEVNGGDDLPIAANGSFVFAQPLNDLGTYVVTISELPTGPLQTCDVTNGNGTIAGANITNVFVTCHPPQPRLTVTIDDTHASARYGMLLDYVVTVTNSSDGNATGVTVANLVPDQLDVNDMHWICVGAGSGATCTASGSGALNDTGVAIPSGRSLTWLVTAPVRLDAAGAAIDYRVDVSGAGTVNATHRDWLVIMRTGMDVPYGDGAEPVGEPVVACSASRASGGAVDINLAGTSVVTVPAFAAAVPVDAILVAHGSGGGFRVERFNAGDRPRVRLVAISVDGSEQASAWTATTSGASLILGSLPGQDGARTLLLDGAEQPLVIALPDGMGAAVRAQALQGACE